jgi:hypothetical protein
MNPIRFNIIPTLRYSYVWKFFWLKHVHFSCLSLQSHATLISYNLFYRLNNIWLKVQVIFSSSLCNFLHSSVTSCPLGPNILLCILFSYNLNVTWIENNAYSDIQLFVKFYISVTALKHISLTDVILHWHYSVFSAEKAFPDKESLPLNPSSVLDRIYYTYLGLAWCGTVHDSTCPLLQVCGQLLNWMTSENTETSVLLEC